MAVFEIGYRPNLINCGLGGVLNHSRWLAALAVSSAHLRILLFPDYAGGGWLTKLFYFVTLFGTQAVVVFFVASGLLVGGSIIRAIMQERFDQIVYAIDRGSRLYIVLIPAVFMTEAFRLFGLSTTCPQPQRLSQLFGNLMFLQNFGFSPLCNNHPLWSLSSEAFFYLIGPPLLITCISRDWRAAAMAAVLVCCAAYFWEPNYQTPLFGLILWLAGLAPWFIRIRLNPWLGILPFAAVLLLSRGHLAFNEFTDSLALAATFAFFLSCDFKAATVPLNRLGIYFAGFSYSLYLIHMPVSQAFASELQRPLSASSLRSYGIYCSALLLILLGAWAFGVMFEDRTKALRNQLMRLRGHF